MKKKFLFISMVLLLCFGLIQLFPTTTNAIFAEDCCGLKIKVVGCGQTCVKPDIATIKFSVNSLGEDAKTLEEENNTKTNEVISKLETLGISKSDIKSIGYSMFSRYDYENGEQVYLGYEISNVLEIKTKELDKITTIISSLTENGIENIMSLNLSVENNENAYNDALKNALENAKNKAEALAGNNNISVSKIFEENFMCNTYSLARFDAKNINSNNFSNILQNDICIKANIFVEFCENTSANTQTDNTNENENLNKESGLNGENNKENTNNENNEIVNPNENITTEPTLSNNDTNLNNKIENSINNTQNENLNNQTNENINKGNTTLTDEILNNDSTNLEN